METTSGRHDGDPFWDESIEPVALEHANAVDHDDPTPASGGGNSDGKRVGRRTIIIIVAAVIVLAIATGGAFIAVGLGSDTDDSSTTDDGSDVSGKVSIPDGILGPSIGAFGSTEEFENEGDTLGSFTSDREWTEVTGEWAIENGDARVVESNEFRNHDVVDLGQGDGVVQVRLDRVTNGAGLVFRFRGPANYWSLTASADTWNLSRFKDTVQDFIGNTGPTTVADTTTVAVRFEGPRIDVLVNGVLRLSLEDDYLMTETKAGLTVGSDGAADARFDDFVAALPGNGPLFVGKETAGEDDEGPTSSESVRNGG